MFEGLGGPIRSDRADLSGIDPTLESCCQREIESNRKLNAVETTLRRHDRIALAERRRRNVIDDLKFGSGCRCCYDPNMDGGEYIALIEMRASVGNLPEQVSNETQLNLKIEQKSNESDSDDDSEFDYLLDEDLPVPGTAGGGDNALMAHHQDRVKELQLFMMMNESAREHGFGVHRQLHPERVLHAAGLGMGWVRGNRAAAIPPAAIIHLYDPESTMSASLDVCLEKLGEEYRGTKYVRAGGRATLTMNEDLARESLPKLTRDTLPALIAVRDGVVVACCPQLSSLGDARAGKVEPHAVEAWLDNARVLLREVPLEFEDYCRIRPEEDALLENMMREKAKLAELPPENIYNCGVKGCCKTFRHQHVGVKNDEQSGLLLCQDIALGTS